MADSPVACSLEGPRMKTRRDEWRDLLVPNLIERAFIPGGIRLVLRAAPGVASELERLIALERSCCAWIDWKVGEGEVLRVEATADQEEGMVLLRDWFQGP